MIVAARHHSPPTRSDDSFLSILAALAANTAIAIAKDTAAVLTGSPALVAVAMRLTGRNRQLLTNQAVPDRYVEALRRRLIEMPGITGVVTLSAVYLGPGEVLVTAEVTVETGQDGDGVVAALDHARSAIGRDVPAIARMYLPPVP